MITIHAVFHAHLDPIWMWPWTEGLDEALATARSACDRLDAHPDLFYTQGEAWSFQMIEEADPELFKRVRAHVAKGRWEVVNGWWTQPDCNIPSEVGLRRQLSIGLAYVKDRFGLAPRCGFNPDSFGHAAILPEILRDHGQDRYVFMRPQEHETALPGRLFRWSAGSGGRPVTAWRIAMGYNNQGWLDGVRGSLSDRPQGCDHALCMFGLGDHGGGPTERSIAWIRKHADAIPGAKLEFSTVGRFFDTVEAQAAAKAFAIPEVVGELQYHAMGCYTAVRGVKMGVRRAEHALAQAEAMGAPADDPAIVGAWRKVCSHHFHDTLGGTCIPSAYQSVFDELGGAAAEAERSAAYRLRQRLATLPDDRLPRIVLCNAGAAPLAAWQEVETYVEGAYCADWRLIDERGAEIPFQHIGPEALTGSGWGWQKRRLILRQDLAKGALRVLRQDIATARAAIPAAVSASGATLASAAGAGIDLRSALPVLSWQGREITSPLLQLIEDGSDTWSHGIDRFGEGGETPRWSTPTIIDRGPLMASARLTGEIGASSLVAEWRTYAGEAWVELLLEVHWRERHRVLKLSVPHAIGERRVDDTPGMALTRPSSGAERPVGEWSELGGGVGVVYPDVFAVDGDAHRLRLTLLRAPLMSHHVPHPGSPTRPVWSDQGVHRFRMRFVLSGATSAVLSGLANAWSRPALVANLTRGMGPRDA